MSRRRLYLMRHAEVSYFRSDGSPVNPTEVPLNEDGITQAHVVAEAFRTIELDRVVTSGLPRTLETAGFVGRIRHPSTVRRDLPLHFDGLRCEEGNPFFVTRAGVKRSADQ